MSLENASPETIAALAQLSDTMLSNPATRTEYQRLLKRASPDIVIPELEVESRVEERIKPMQEQLADMQKQREMEAAQQATNTLYESLRDSGAVTSRADFNDLVKHASDKGFMTSEAGLRMAASHRKDERRAAEPTPTNIGAVGGFKKEEIKDWFKDPAGRARAEAAAAMAEMGIGGAKH